jgi:alpha-ketoglutarate-dependent taurine dioxygenase
MSDLPFIVRPSGTVNPATWLSENQALVETQLNRSGAILLRTSGATTMEHFRDAVHLLCDQGLRYVYRSTPRTDLGGGLYTATEYPPALSIPFHNENAFQREWPLLLLFFCMQPADDGHGQTPLADTLKVTSRIDPAVRNRFSEKHVMYIRNYRADVDLPWQTVFQTDSKQDVEAFCAEHEIEYEWTSGGNLRTRQICQSFANNPRTGDTVWFNQAHLFHPSSLSPATREAMEELLDVNEFPRNVTYGDGSPLEESALANIRHAFEQESTQFKWEKGDILILDNMRVSHARTPFRGQRRVLTAMGRPFRPEYRPPGVIH